MAGAATETLHLDPLLKQELFEIEQRVVGEVRAQITAVPDRLEDIVSRQKAAQFIGACLTGNEVDLSFAETSQQVRPIESLFDALRLAAEGDASARKMVEINVATDVIERTTKSGHIMQVELNVDESGRIQQHGQYMESVHANSLRYASGNAQMLARTKAEATNAFRIADAYEKGDLEDYYFVVFSRAADDMSEAQMKDAGFFTDTMSVAIQATTATGATLTTESAFVAGKRTIDAERHDGETIEKVGQALLIDFANKSATEILATPLLVHKDAMPDGVVDLVKLYDQCAGGTFFGEAKPPQDYGSYRQLCKQREERFQPKVNLITTKLIDEAATITNRVHATERLHQLSQDEMVAQAVHDNSINPDVFGPAAQHIIAARIRYEQGDIENATALLRQAQKTAVSSSCPSAKNGEEAHECKEAEDKYGARTFKCKNGHTNHRPYGRLIRSCWVIGCTNSVAC